MRASHLASQLAFAIHNLFLASGENPVEKCRQLRRRIRKRTQDMYHYMGITNNITADRGKLVAQMKKRKKEDRPDRDGLVLFTSSSGFLATREPLDIARELYTAFIAVPPKWTAHGTEQKLKELVDAYEAKAKQAGSNKDRLPLLHEHFKCKKLLENFSTAINQPNGAARSRLYEIVNGGIVNGKWKDNLEDAMERVKKEYEATWKEKLLPRSAQKPAAKPKPGAKPISTSLAITPAPASSTSSSSTGSSPSFQFKNLTAYRKAGVRSLKPAFPLPSMLPQGHDKWCADCCWGDHTTDECRRSKLPAPPRPPQGFSA